MENFITAWRRLRRGNVSARAIVLETQRRIRVAFERRRERTVLSSLQQKPAELSDQFSQLSQSDLLDHFRCRTSPKFFHGFETANSWAALEEGLSALFLRLLLGPAEGIVEHRWELLGFGKKDFGDRINWNRDPLSGRSWPLDYHADIPLWHDDGSDIRALWELNRLSHLVVLGRAYVAARARKLDWRGYFDKDIREADEEFFLQVESWHEQNPLGRGANWACAMEVALRSISLLTAFSLFRGSPRLNQDRLLLLLKMFDQHGAHIRRNLEFSHIATSNHYLSDVTGLLWLGIMLPELRAAAEWREWALQEMLREMDKQILEDGVDYEGATAYHRFVLELFLYSFLLCRENEISIPDKYWNKLHGMLKYLRLILAPGSRLPLIGDCDDSYVWPNCIGASHEENLLTIGAVVFNDPTLSRWETVSELLWVLGEEGSREATKLMVTSYPRGSAGFPQAGAYVLRNEDLELVFTANNPQPESPTSHRHNDALSVEVVHYGSAFIVDPGTYVYTANLQQRHLFRSTAYHSTIQIDNEEQQTIREDEPFKNGGEANVRVLQWRNTEEQVHVVAEHRGYERLREPVTHRRAITFNKVEGWWWIEDELSGRGNHAIATRFHFDADLEVALYDEQSVIVKDPMTEAKLFVCSWGAEAPLRLELEPQFVSREYGSKLPSTTARWTIQTNVPYRLCWAIVPVRPTKNLEERIRLIRSPTSSSVK